MMSSTGVLIAGVIAACVSLFLSILIGLTRTPHGRLSLYVDLSRAQKFYKTPVPRIGGVALSIALPAALLHQALDYTKLPFEGGSSKILLLLLAVTSGASPRRSLCSSVGIDALRSAREVVANLVIDWPNTVVRQAQISSGSASVVM
jgi:hypothetical protein